MGADNWAICPQCKAKAVKEQAAKLQRVNESYGKVPPEEFIKASAEAQQVQILKPTLREDYELGIWPDGTFDITYSADCTICNLEFSYKYSQPVELKS